MLIGARSLSTHIARVNFFFIVSSFVQALRGFVLIPLFLQWLGTAEYGLWVLVMTWAGYAFVIVLMALDISIYQFVTPFIAERKGRQIYWTIVAIEVLWSAALYVVLTVIFITGHAPLVAMYCGLYVAGQVLWTLFLAPFRCEERPDVFFGISSLIILGDLGLTIAILLVRRDIQSIVAALGVYHCAVALLMFAVQSFRFRPLYFAQGTIRPTLYFGFSMMLSQLIVGGYYVLDKTIISFFSGLEAIAIYAPPMALAMIIMPLNNSGTSTLPTLLVNKDVRNSKDLKSQVMQSAIKQWCLLALPAALGVSLVARPVLAIIASEHIAQIGASIAWFGAPAIFIDGMGRFAFAALRSEHDVKWITVVRVLHFAFYLAVVSTLSSIWSNEASHIVVITMLAVNISFAWLCYWRLRRYVSHPITYQTISSPLAGAAAIALIAAVTPRVQSPMGLIVFITICVVAYAAIIIRLERFNLRKLR